MSTGDVAALVREYVTLINSADELSPYELLSTCRTLLPRIYAVGVQLPEIEPDDTSGPPEVESPYDALASRFGKLDHYREVFDPFAADPPVFGSLSDDLADVYIDLAAGLIEYDAGRVANAQWTWRFVLREHAGDHLVGALKAIHWLLDERMDPEFDPTGGAA